MAYVVMASWSPWIYPTNSMIASLGARVGICKSLDTAFGSKTRKMSGRGNLRMKATMGPPAGHNYIDHCYIGHNCIRRWDRRPALRRP